MRIHRLVIKRTCHQNETLVDEGPLLCFHKRVPAGTPRCIASLCKVKYAQQQYQ